VRRLSDTVKRRIVEHLACFRTHAEVASLIFNEFDVQLTPRHIRAYDPLSFQFAGSAHWLDYHQLVRKRCSQELGEIAIAHRAYRLKQLQWLLDQAMDLGNHRQAMDLLEQAAKEVGNCYVK
jgi:hypothetical protein